MIENTEKTGLLIMLQGYLIGFFSLANIDILLSIILKTVSIFSVICGIVIVFSDVKNKVKKWIQKK